MKFPALFLSGENEGKLQASSSHKTPTFWPLRLAVGLICFSLKLYFQLASINFTFIGSSLLLLQLPQADTYIKVLRLLSKEYGSTWKSNMAGSLIISKIRHVVCLTFTQHIYFFQATGSWEEKKEHFWPTMPWAMLQPLNLQWQWGIFCRTHLWEALQKLWRGGSVKKLKMPIFVIPWYFSTVNLISLIWAVF